jgi:hypothetical protein
MLRMISLSAALSLTGTACVHSEAVRAGFNCRLPCSAQENYVELRLIEYDVSLCELAETREVTSFMVRRGHVVETVSTLAEYRATGKPMPGFLNWRKEPDRFVGRIEVLVPGSICQ